MQSSYLSHFPTIPDNNPTLFFYFYVIRTIYYSICFNDNYIVFTSSCYNIVDFRVHDSVVKAVRKRIILSIKTKRLII